MEQEKVLLNVEETAAYLNLGMTKTRELMRENEKIFVVISSYSINGCWHRSESKSRMRNKNSHVCFARL